MGLEEGQFDITNGTMLVGNAAGKGQEKTFAEVKVLLGVYTPRFQSFPTNGTTTNFTLSYTPIASSETVFVGGMELQASTHYTIAGNQLVISPACSSGLTLTIKYWSL